MARAQGALEYLIIISVAVSILAVVTFLSATSISTAKSDYSTEQCREAAASCKMSISGNPSDPCILCDLSCNYSNGTELYPGAISCCKLGRPSDIYDGMASCTLYVPMCGNSIMDPAEQCDDGNAISTDACIDCVSAECGDGYLWSGVEQCDGAETGECTYGCTAECDCSTCPIPAISFVEQPIDNPSDIASGFVSSVAIGNADNIAGNEIIASVFDSTNPKLLKYAYSSGAWQLSNVDTVYPLYNSIAIGDADNTAGNDIIAGGYGVYDVQKYTYLSGVWQKSNVGDTPTITRAVAIGTADNTAGNEVIIGAANPSTSSLGNNTRVYSFSPVLSQWVETNVSQETCACDVYSVTAGDADNIAGNEIVIGDEGGMIKLYKPPALGGTWTKSTIYVTGAFMILSVAVGNADNIAGNEIIAGTQTAGLVMYQYVGGSWVRTNIPSTLSGTVYSVAIGDADNDGENEIVAGTSTNQLKMYDYVCGAWQEYTVANLDYPVRSVAIGDADNVGGNEIVIGTDGGSSVSEIRAYKKSW